MIKLYRGFREKLEPGRMKNIFRDKARTPLHSNPNAHHHADEWFKKNFEVAARSTTIICSTDVAQARRYAENGSTLQILPRNPYRLIFSEYVKDFISYIVFARKPLRPCNRKGFELFCRREDLKNPRILVTPVRNCGANREIVKNLRIQLALI